jgi:hypothetical protein
MLTLCARVVIDVAKIVMGAFSFSPVPHIQIVGLRPDTTKLISLRISPH